MEMRTHATQSTPIRPHGRPVSGPDGGGANATDFAEGRIDRNFRATEVRGPAIPAIAASALQVSKGTVTVRIDKRKYKLEAYAVTPPGAGPFPLAVVSHGMPLRAGRCRRQQVAAAIESRQQRPQALASVPRRRGAQGLRHRTGRAIRLGGVARHCGRRGRVGHEVLHEGGTFVSGDLRRRRNGAVAQGKSTVSDLRPEPRGSGRGSEYSRHRYGGAEARRPSARQRCRRGMSESLAKNRIAASSLPAPRLPRCRRS